LSEEDRAAATVKCTENFVKFGHVVLRYASGQTDRQTDRQTDTLIAILCPPTGDEVITEDEDLTTL